MNMLPWNVAGESSKKRFGEFKIGDDESSMKLRPPGPEVPRVASGICLFGIEYECVLTRVFSSIFSFGLRRATWLPPGPRQTKECLGN